MTTTTCSRALLTKLSTKTKKTAPPEVPQWKTAFDSFDSIMGQLKQQIAENDRSLARHTGARDDLMQKVKENEEKMTRYIGWLAIAEQDDDEEASSKLYREMTKMEKKRLQLIRQGDQTEEEIQRVETAGKELNEKLTELQMKVGEEMKRCEKSESFTHETTFGKF